MPSVLHQERPRACRPPSSRRTECLAALAALTAAALSADVFWRMPSTADATLCALGGARVYATDVTVNGAPGSLAAYAFGETPATLRTRLARQLNLPLPVGAGQGAALLTHVRNNSMQRLLVLPAAAGLGGCVVLAFEQKLRAAAAASREPPAWPDGLPALNADRRLHRVLRQDPHAFCYGRKQRRARGRQRGMPRAPDRARAGPIPRHARRPLTFRSATNSACSMRTAPTIRRHFD
jgi:hypothetical protein